jgi:uroporphyrinogen decarboxylase
MDGREDIVLDTGPLPSFVPRTLEENERWRTTLDGYGFTVRTLKEQSVSPTLYYYLAGSVSSRADWERLKARYDPHDCRRLPRAWGPELWEHLNQSTSPVSMRIDWGPGRGAKNGYTLGLELFLDRVVSDPGLVKDMFDFWADFVIEAARPWLEHVRFDFVYFTEDGMGYKNSTLVSPKMYQRLWIPAMRRVTDFLHGHGVDIIAHYTSGNIRPLMPTLLDIGVNLYFPLEVAAGMDAHALRREFGREVRLIGNISRQALMDGPQAVAREFEAKVPPLMAVGGYIPAVDDAIMPDIGFGSYRCYVELVRSYRCS